MSFINALHKAIENRTALFFDGGMGTMLQTSSVKKWNIPEELNITHPDLICRIHTEYLDAGCDIITTNTFGANSLKLAPYNYRTDEVVRAATSIARKAVSAFNSSRTASKYVAFDMGPTGHLLQPMGSLSFDDAYAAFAESAVGAEKEGADLVIIETMSDLYEMKAAILAVKENTSLPVIASVTFQDTDLMLTGATVQTAVTVLESLGADALGFNCGGDLVHAKALCADFIRYASIPVIVQPNAGIPIIENGQTVFKITPNEFAEAVKTCAQSGAYILGGCCGTTPKHITAMIRSCRAVRIPEIIPKHTTAITSWCHTVTIGEKPVIIGERINPTGKKRFKSALLENDFEYIVQEAAQQIAAGAHILDVNVGLPDINEIQVMHTAITYLQKTFSIPLQIDSSETTVLEKALRYYNGKALVNSVNGKEEVMSAVFPLIKKYGGVIVALTLDENGIPPTAQGRIAIAQRIIARAGDFGIERKNIIIDALTLTISSQQKEADETLKAVRSIKNDLHMHTILGVSNISFGLPRREIINTAFFTMALQAGLDACIINPLSQEMLQAYYAYCALSGVDENCLQYIEHFSGTTAAVQQDRQNHSIPNTQAVSEPDLYSIIIQGFKEQAASITEKMLMTVKPVDIINTVIVPALDSVGKDFESGKKFLPQLLLSADTVAQAFEVIKKHLAQTGEKTASKGTVLIATVYGDIHDIGKNIVRAMLENYGYTVIDMGKNVPAEAIVERVCRDRIRLVGLSALMTTTVTNMEHTIAALKKASPDTKIMVGGAVLTADYAKKIGADFYTKDAMASVAIAKGFFT